MTMHRPIAALTLALSVVQLCSGCTPTPAAQSPAPRVVPSNGQASTPTLRDVGWAKFTSKRFALTIGLPEGTLWKIDDHPGEWLRATHPAGALLRAKVWTTTHITTRDRCEEQVRAWLPDLPTPEGQEVIDDRELTDFPARGFKTRLLVGLAPATVATPVSGLALAIGVSERKCVAMVFTTSASGPTAPIDLAARLAIGARILGGSVLNDMPTPEREPFDRPASAAP